ncbi:uncharacterized protein [Dendropsophus ebraccatus]|uniref:uncharacterized protein n=1 Tax=Dendropsophus ebraccatus TaxID=150705 RepID=UPI0038323193
MSELQARSGSSESECSVFDYRWLKKLDRKYGYRIHHHYCGISKEEEDQTALPLPVEDTKTAGGRSTKKESIVSSSSTLPGASGSAVLMAPRDSFAVHYLQVLKEMLAFVLFSYTVLIGALLVAGWTTYLLVLK